MKGGLLGLSQLPDLNESVPRAVGPWRVKGRALAYPPFTSLPCWSPHHTLANALRPNSPCGNSSKSRTIRLKPIASRAAVDR